jgi:hypothetical protein
VAERAPMGSFPDFIGFVFHGKRFESHARLPVAVMPALVAFEEGVKELAAQRYRRVREVAAVPSGFRAKFMLTLDEIRDNCVDARLGVSVASDKIDLGFYEAAKEEFVGLLHRAQEGRPVEDLHPDVVRRLVNVVSVLDERERLELRGGRGGSVNVTSHALQTLRSWRTVETVREDRMLLGTVIGGRLNEYVELRIGRYDGVELKLAYPHALHPTISTAYGDPDQFEVRARCIIDRDLSGVPVKGVEVLDLELVAPAREEADPADP